MNPTRREFAVRTLMAGVVFGAWRSKILAAPGNPVIAGWYADPEARISPAAAR